jgi:glycosyltransferase involved in cell wall biosynthesis
MIVFFIFLSENAKLKDMKILIVITKSELGGAQVFALSLAKGLKEAGEEVVVAGGPGEYLPQELSKLNIEFKRLNNLERSRNPFKNLSFIKELTDYVKNNQFRVVHLNSTNALLGVWGLAKLKNRPRVVFTVHGLSLLDSGHKTLGIIKAAYRWFFRLAFLKLDQIVFVSRLNLDFAKSSGLISGLEKKVSLIYNGLEKKVLLSRESAREKLGLSNSDYIYGSIGRLAYPKNYEFLINIYPLVKTIKPEAKLVLIGEGPERVKYEHLIKLYGLEGHVILVGEKPEAGLYLNAFDLFVLPSIFEGLSLSLIEAVLNNIPAIASRVGGNEEVIGAENCFKLNDKQEFLELVKRNSFISSEKRDFSAKTMVASYYGIYSL